MGNTPRSIIAYVQEKSPTVLLTPDDIDNFHSRNDIQQLRLELQQARERGEVEFEEYVNDDQDLWRLFIGFMEMRDLAQKHSRVSMFFYCTYKTNKTK
ncbi:hypothetical protein PsorP6_013962 [Peronosclerospora sorghi]|uniref:Uncharacterized protein n=1 Tax=Peronosclerospora sorghi TaxID=230839 RepID=A0ACC0VFG4_9STRA|nr:hypothetical protein PsorP6_013962 [Peronosclerospora sorghi]